MKDLELLIDTCVKILKLPITALGYTFTLWEALIYFALLFIIMVFVFATFK